MYTFKLCRNSASLSLQIKHISPAPGCFRVFLERRGLVPPNTHVRGWPPLGQRRASGPVSHSPMRTHVLLAIHVAPVSVGSRFGAQVRHDRRPLPNTVAHGDAPTTAFDSPGSTRTTTMMDGGRASPSGTTLSFRLARYGRRGLFLSTDEHVQVCEQRVLLDGTLLFGDAALRLAHADAA